jgi:hypothetical protein
VPLVGNPYQAEVVGGLAGSSGLFDRERSRGRGCSCRNFGGSLYVGSPLLVVQPFVLDGEGSSSPLLKIAALSPSLCGLVAVAQAAVLDAGAQGGAALTNALRIQVGSSFGPMFPGQVYSTGGSSRDLRAGDLDGDGVLDIVAANFDLGSLSILLGHGDGTYADFASHSMVFGHAYALELVDFDGDGTLDAGVGDGADEVALTFGQGDGGFGAVQHYPSGSSNALAAADFDADGDLDLAAPDTHLGGFADSIWVFPNDGAGALGAPVLHPTDGDPEDLAPVDVDGDGAIDIVLTKKYTTEVGVLLNAGSGGLRPRSGRPGRRAAPPHRRRRHRRRRRRRSPHRGFRRWRTRPAGGGERLLHGARRSA